MPFGVQSLIPLARWSAEESYRSGGLQCLSAFSPLFPTSYSQVDHRGVASLQCLSAFSPLFPNQWIENNWTKALCLQCLSAFSPLFPIAWVVNVPFVL